MKNSWLKYVDPILKNRILYICPVHECSECVKQMCDGILYYDKDALIVLHVSKSSQIKDFEICLSKNVFINPVQFETYWGCDFMKVIISNYFLILKETLFRNPLLRNKVYMN